MKILKYLISTREVPLFGMFLILLVSAVVYAGVAFFGYLEWTLLTMERPEKPTPEDRRKVWEALERR